MATVVALFDSYGDADRAVSMLSARGFQRGDVGVVASEHTVKTWRDRDADGVPSSDAAEGAGEGAVLGGVTGLLAGVAALVLPGVGPLFVAGALSSVFASTVAGATAGAVAGGLLGALTSMGLPDSVAETYAEGVKSGGVLVSVTTDRPDVAAEILRANDGKQVHREEAAFAV